MKYREKLLELMLEGTDEEMVAWLEAQPLLEQPDILREVKQIAEEAAEENGDDLNEVLEGFENFDGIIDNYEDKILDEKLAEAQYIMALEEQEKLSKKMFEQVQGMKEYAIECILTNADNATEIRELAKLVIKFEVDAGIYNEEDWKGIDGLSPDEIL